MDKLNIANLARGAVVEQFDFELQKTLDNIMDLNTDTAKVRKITISVSIKPSKNRNTATVAVQTKSTLVPVSPLETNIMMDRDSTGHIVAEEFGMDQLSGQVDMESLVADKETGEILNAKVVQIKK